MYEYFEHTADVGIRVRGSDLSGVLADAGRAFSGLIVENLDAVRPVETAHITVQVSRTPEGELDYLLFDWLGALLAEFESTGRIFVEFDIRVGTDSLTAECRGEPLDPSRHRLGHEVKAITYHQLELRKTDDGYVGQVILDL